MGGGQKNTHTHPPPHQNTKKGKSREILVFLPLLFLFDDGVVVVVLR
jgi:hypothetical protein